MTTTRRNMLCALAGASGSLLPAQSSTTSTAATQWAVVEIPLTARQPYSNPYTQVEVAAEFTGPNGERQRVRGYWDGAAAFKVRFTPPRPGAWHYTTSSVPADPGLTSSGTLIAGRPATNAHGFLRNNPQHPYSFIHDDGTQLFLFGSTYYDLLSSAVAGNAWHESIAGIQRYGMNKVRFSLCRLNGKRDERNPLYTPSQPFVGSSQDELNLEHWRALDRVVQHMSERGVIADLILFGREQVASGTDEQYRRFLRYAIARYAAFPNVTWCLTNEWEYTKQPRAFWDAMGRLAQQEDPWARLGQARRGLSVHQQTRYDFQLFDTSQDWLSHAIVQLGVRNRGKAFRGGDEWNQVGRDLSKVMRQGDDWGHFSIAHNWGHKMPVLNDEYGYIGEFDDQTEPKDASGKPAVYTRDKHRRTMWGISLAGGYGAAGDKNLYPDGRPYFSGQWHDTPEYGDIRHLIQFWTRRSIPHWQREAQQDSVISGTRVYACRAGEHWIIYAAAGGKLSLRLPQGKYQAMQVDPRTGAEQRIEAKRTGDTYALLLPDQQDWIVHLRRG